MLKFLAKLALLVAGLLMVLGQPSPSNGRIIGGLDRVSAQAMISGAHLATANLSQPVAEDDGLKRAKALVRVINQYRQEQGLEEIPYSPWLTYVARYHVYDLETNDPAHGSCNLHSWSDRGEWSACCYTSDHARADCMWNKPKELSKGAYEGVGFEIAAKNTGGMTSQGALAQWQGSRGHHDVILNRGIWANRSWKAIGAAVSNYYAVVWFGD